MGESVDLESKARRLIEDFVKQHWQSTQSVCYFSSIGVFLQQTAPNVRSVMSNGLGEFLRNNPVVRVVQFPGVSQKIGAVPLSVKLPEDVKQLFSGNKATSNWDNRRLYLQEFWDAFVRPIQGERRYVLVDKFQGITVYDGPLDDESGEAYEILPQDLTAAVPNGSIADKVNATHEAIQSWLKKQSLDASIFLRPRIRRHDVAMGLRLAKFLSAFDGLSSDDLARINVPLDIITKLVATDDH